VLCASAFLVFVVTLLAVLAVQKWRVANLIVKERFHYTPFVPTSIMASTKL
jgi:hypothetical protein